MFNIKTIHLLFLIFAASLLIRFLYFPENIYFGYDQARDAFATAEILSGNLKVVGPPTTFTGLNHGVLYYYLYSPFYFLDSGDPSFPAAFLRIINATGIFLVFLLTSVLFNKYVGLISSLLFAFSFEQTQFALYLNHPSLAVVSILIMYLGLALLIFKKKRLGLIVASLGLGLSIQFEFILTYLIVPFIAMLIYLRKEIKINLKDILVATLVFLLSISSFIVGEFKFGFTSFQSLPSLFLGAEKSISNIFAGYIYSIDQMIRFNFGLHQHNFLFVIALLAFLKLLFSKVKKQMIFLGFWFFSVFLIYIVSGGGDSSSSVVQYHPNVGTSISLLIFISYLIYSLFLKSRVLAALVLIIIIGLNLSMILKFNQTGSIAEINAQSGMLLSDEKKVLDFIYQDSQGKLFAVKAITMPFYINTTWSYLFEWYGLQKYGYLPIWGGKNALGYGGNLVVETAQDKLPDIRFLIIEPIRGIPQHLINEFLEEESYFSDILLDIKIGKFTVQKRIKK